MKIVLAGATGFVGSALVRRLLEDGHSLTVLSRRVDAFKDMPSQNLKVEIWDGKTAGVWTQALEGADAVVNLAGESIAAGRWTSARKKALRDSRLETTRALVQAIAALSNKPKLLINASAVGFYGDVPRGPVTESSLGGRGFLAELCAAWESEARKAEGHGLRVVLLRLGVVLEREGGALPKFLTPFNLYIGGPLGSGRQYFPWVHRGDVVGIVLFVLRQPQLFGAFNVSAPGVLTMKDFCSALGRAMGRPSWAPVPGFVLKTLLGEMSEMLLTGQQAVPARLQQAGYEFRFPEAETALRNILQK
jgi:uncharacterized protein